MTNIENANSIIDKEIISFLNKRKNNSIELINYNEVDFTLNIDNDLIIKRIEDINTYRLILDNLIKQPLIKQRTTEWFEARKNRLTASDLYDAIKDNKISDSIAKKNYFTLSSAFFCLTIIFILIGVTKFENQKSNIQAIIFEKKIDFRTEPNYRSEIQFNLHEGTKVNIIDELDDWVLVELSNGASGWMELKSIKKIN